MESYDFLVIGGGSAGYAAARTAQAMGKRVAIVDGAGELGGLCILRGCMPSKTLLHPADILHHARHSEVLGLRVKEARLDMPALQAWKRKVIGEFATDRREALESGNYGLYRSYAWFIGPDLVELGDGTRLRAERIFIGTGSKVNVPPLPGLAETPFWTSDEVLELDFVPSSVIVLGGGPIACEFAQFLDRIGAKVILLQRSERLLKEYSHEAAEVIEGVLRQEGAELHTGTQVEEISAIAHGVRVRFRKGDEVFTRDAAHLFNALGREPNVADLNLEAAGVEVSEGRIKVNAWQQTTNERVYAGGDACGPYDVVHLAVAQGELAAGHAFGRSGLEPIEADQRLSVVFTDPPLASLGLNEAELEARGVKFFAASHPFADHGKSILMNAKTGFVKILADATAGRLLGAEIVGVQGDSLIHCLSGPLAMKATVRDLLKAPWYHPTLAEILVYPLEEIADKLTGNESP
jgi:pyruvate/2-oxoglutarate dehydrogenase complex dihydrolipoamide dehydrogenase (E3) component